MAAEWHVESRRQDARMVASIVRLQGGGRLRFAAADVARGLSQGGPSSRRAGAPPRRRMPSVQRRTLDNAMVAAGLACDKRKRWAGCEVVEWRGSTLVKREARVRWKGFDPDTGEPWADTWEPLKNLTSDWQEEGRIRPKKQRVARTAARRAASGREMDDDGRRRKSPRVGGVAPGPGLA